MSSTATANFFLILVAAEPDVEAVIDIFDDDEDVLWGWGRDFYIDFRYKKGKPAVIADPWDVSVGHADQNVDPVTSPLPDIISVTPRVPDVTGTPSEWKFGQVRLRAPENPTSSPTHMTMLDYVLSISFVQPDGGSEGSRYITGNSPIIGSYEENSDQSITIDGRIPGGVVTDTNGNDIPVTIDAQTSITKTDRTTVTNDWAAKLAEIVIDYDLVESIISDDVNPSETISGEVTMRATVDATEPDFATRVRSAIDARWGDGELSAEGTEYHFGFIPIAFLFPPRTKGPSVPQGLIATYDGTNVIFRWQRPAYLGGSYLKRYEYEVTSDSSFSNNIQDNGNSHSVSIANPTIGATYKFRVRAINGAEQASGFVETSIDVNFAT